MIHTSKINNKHYNISFSMQMENCELKYDDITLIWDFCNASNVTKLVGWYFGSYDFETTECYIRRYLQNEGM